MRTGGEARELESLLDAAPCGFLTFGDDGHVRLVNRTLLDLLGYERDEVAGAHVEKLLTVGSRIFYQTHLFPLARLHGRADEIFIQLRAKDGRDIGTFVNVRRREEDGGALYDVALMQVAERAKYERELILARQAAEEQRRLIEEQAAELEATTEELTAANEELVAQTEELERLRAEAESANRAKTGFLAVMSHELRTPLNAISGYVQILSLGIQGPITDQQRETLERVDRAQAHLLRLINDLLNLSKVEAGTIDYRLAAIDLADVADAVRALVEPQTLEKGLRLVIDVPAGRRVYADRDKLEQILLNLLSNAIKFTPPGGRIDVLSEPAAAGMVAVSVRDTGIGIPEDKLDAVFEPFVQVESDHNKQGTGLGLAISRDFARGMEGDLKATSRPGAGTTFTLVLPAADERPADEGPAGERAAGG